MKAVFILMVIVGVGIFLVYQFGISGFDPAEQAKELKAVATPGTSWTVVADKFPPRKFKGYNLDADGFVVESIPIDYDKATIESMIANGDAQFGFFFMYNFSEQEKYNVNFNAEGKVESVDKAPSMSDLLN